MNTQHALAELGLSREQFSTLDGAVAALFTVFARRFGVRWDRQFNDPGARATWQFDFENAKLTPREVLIGLVRCGFRDWPPSTGEFIATCRDIGVPSQTVGMAEAVRAQRVGFFEHAWSHPVIAAAARSLGTWVFTTSSQQDLARQWSNAYAEALELHRMGRLVLKDLPQLAYQPVSEPEAPVPRLTTAQALTEMRRMLGMEAAS